MVVVRLLLLSVLWILVSCDVHVVASHVPLLHEKKFQIHCPCPWKCFGQKQEDTELEQMMPGIETDNPWRVTLCVESRQNDIKAQKEQFLANDGIEPPSRPSCAELGSSG